MWQDRRSAFSIFLVVRSALYVWFTCMHIIATAALLCWPGQQHESLPDLQDQEVLEDHQSGEKLKKLVVSKPFHQSLLGRFAKPICVTHGDFRGKDDLSSASGALEALAGHSGSGGLNAHGQLRWFQGCQNLLELGHWHGRETRVRNKKISGDRNEADVERLFLHSLSQATRILELLHRKVVTVSAIFGNILVAWFERLLSTCPGGDFLEATISLWCIFHPDMHMYLYICIYTADGWEKACGMIHGQNPKESITERYERRSFFARKL